MRLQAEDKETKLAQAKECVNDVKDVVEILAKQLNDNQMVSARLLACRIHIMSTLCIAVMLQELEHERRGRAEVMLKSAVALLSTIDCN